MNDETAVYIFHSPIYFDNSQCMAYDVTTENFALRSSNHNANVANCKKCPRRVDDVGIEQLTRD